MQTLTKTERQRRNKDVAKAASLLLDAVNGAPDRVMQTVQIPYGKADVILDDGAVDVVLHDRDVTVHVRRDGGADPEGRDGSDPENAA